MGANRHRQARVSAAAALSPIGVLDAARKAVPAVDYALGAAGIAAAGAIVVAFLGNGRGAVIVLGGMLVAMVLLFVFARLLATRNAATIQAALALMWMVVAFFGLFLAFTATAIAIQWPPAWAQILGIDTPNPDKRAMEKLLVVPKDLSNSIFKNNPRLPIELVRLQPRLSDRVAFARRDEVMRGGGAFYSFIRRTHEYGFGSNISLEEGAFRTGFTTSEYGFFMYVGQGTTDELARFDANAPPQSLDPTHGEGWKYMWTYRPPADAAIKDEHKRARGFSVGGVPLSEQVTVNKEGIYLLRSISIGRSDILVGFIVVDTLGDGSVVLAWRTLKIFDTPIAVRNED
jgi:hypothetical protein